MRLELDDHNYLAGPAASVASFLKMGRGQSPSDILPIEGDKVHYVAHIDNILICKYLHSSVRRKIFSFRGKIFAARSKIFVDILWPGSLLASGTTGTSVTTGGGGGGTCCSQATTGGID